MSFQVVSSSLLTHYLVVWSLSRSTNKPQSERESKTMTTNNTRAASLANAKTRTIEAVDALSAHLLRLRGDVEAIQTVESAEAVCASVKQALSLHTTMSMSARYVRQTILRPGKTSAEALLRRGDPAGVIAELFVIVPHREEGQVYVQHDDKKAIDKIVWSCWPTVYSKYGVDLPEGSADALARAWKAYLRANGGLAFCRVAGEYAAIARAGR